MDEMLEMLVIVAVKTYSTLSDNTQRKYKTLCYFFLSKAN